MNSDVQAGVVNTKEEFRGTTAGSCTWKERRLILCMVYFMAVTSVFYEYLCTLKYT